MSSVFKPIAVVAGLVAAVASIPVTGGASIAGYAALISAGASIAASLTQKKPPVLGGTTDITIGSNMQTPYVMGRTYPRAALIHDVGYGPTTNDVPNPYRSFVFILSGGGPIEEIEAVQGDFSTIPFSGAAATGYYSGFLWKSTQLGAAPEAAALSGPHGAIPGWGSAYKLSGYPAMLLTLKHDRKGKVWSAGVPQWGAVVRGVLVYDQRQDDTYDGGSGDCRALEEDTYVGGEAAENPSCQGVTYALGRYQNGKKVFGCGFAVDAIDWPAWTEFANVCEANEWKIGGTIFEPGSRWGQAGVRRRPALRRLPAAARRARYDHRRRPGGWRDQHSGHEGLAGPDQWNRPDLSFRGAQVGDGPVGPCQRRILCHRRRGGEDRGTRL
jgi:hypothetical protein